MTIPFKKLILRGVALAVAAAVGYTGHMLSRLAPIATGYAAKALCSGVYVSGRPAASVIDVDIMAGVHPLLKLVHPSIDPDHHRATATFAGFAEREADFRPGPAAHSRSGRRPRCRPRCRLSPIRHPPSRHRPRCRPASTRGSCRPRSTARSTNPIRRGRGARARSS